MPDVRYGQRLTDVLVGYGLAPVEELYTEIYEMWDVLLGRRDAPALPQSPYLALQEISTAYLGRALEIDGKILRAEAEKEVEKNSPLQKFRTGALADFIVLARRAADLGSRRLTEFQMLHEESTRSSY